MIDKMRAVNAICKECGDCRRLCAIANDPYYDPPTCKYVQILLDQPEVIVHSYYGKWYRIDKDTPRGVDLIFRRDFSGDIVVGKIVHKMPDDLIVVQSDFLKKTLGLLSEFYFWSPLPMRPDPSDFGLEDEE